MVEPIKFIIRALERASSSEIRRYLGFSAAELADGLIQISINDENKKKVLLQGPSKGLG